ncbi:MAG: hypothetical protein A2W17_01675 [Planctomycetes bacterium RBG_16_41_13]|nr:MAG: hypothetical protein A2W17_01675 [Planctomycetes bacterium RBG_16_41_13]
MDRCGSIINEIMNNYPAWTQETVPDPQNAPLICLENGMKLNFSTTKYDFSLEQPFGDEADLTQSDIEKFIDQADSISSLINERLDLKIFTRIGFRIWYIFRAETLAAAENWIKQLLGTVPFDDQITKALNNGIVEARNYAVVIASSDRKFRISINGVESYAKLDIRGNILDVRTSKLHKDQDKYLLKQLKEKKRVAKNPHFASMIDIDSFVETPNSVEAKDFIGESLRQVEEALPKAFKNIT